MLTHSTRTVLDHSDLQMVLMVRCANSGGKIFEIKGSTTCLTPLAYDNLEVMTSELTHKVTTGQQLDKELLTLFSTVVNQFRDTCSNSRLTDRGNSRWSEEVEEVRGELSISGNMTGLVVSQEKSSSITGKNKTKKNESKVKSSPKKNSTKSEKKGKPATVVVPPPSSTPVKIRTFKSLLKHEFGRSIWVEKLMDVYDNRIHVNKLAPVVHTTAPPCLTGTCSLPTNDLHDLAECQVCRENSQRGDSGTMSKREILIIALAHLEGHGMTLAQIETIDKMLTKFNERKPSSSMDVQ
jgi:hypothetical protein